MDTSNFELVNNNNSLDLDGIGLGQQDPVDADNSLTSASQSKSGLSDLYRGLAGFDKATGFSFNLFFPW